MLLLRSKLLPDKSERPKKSACPLIAGVGKPNFATQTRHFVAVAQNLGIA